jgi:hypothetical protein
MPTNRTRRARRWRATLDPGKRVSLAREAMAKDWAAHGEALTEWWVAAAPEPVGHPWEHVSPGGPGTRPWAWWEFSCPGNRRKGEAEATALARLGVLTADERARMRWKR